MGAGHKLVDPEVGLRVKKNRDSRVLFKSKMGTKLGPLPLRFGYYELHHHRKCSGKVADRYRQFYGVSIDLLALLRRRRPICNNHHRAHHHWFGVVVVAGLSQVSRIKHKGRLFHRRFRLDLNFCDFRPALYDPRIDSCFYRRLF